MAGPGYVRRKPQALRVGGVQQRMVFGQRLGGEYIQSRARYPAFVDRFRQGGLVHDRPSAEIDKVCSGLHKSELPCADQAPGAFVQGAMDADYIGFSHQFIQAERRPFLAVRCTRSGIIHRLHPQGGGYLRHPPADVSHTDDADGLAIEFVEWLPHIVRHSAARISEILDFGVIECRPAEEGEDMGECQLRHRFRGVAGDVAHGYAAPVGGLQVYVVQACGRNADKLKPWRCGHHGIVHGGFVGQDDIGVRHPQTSLLVSRNRIKYQISQCGDGVQ